MFSSNASAKSLEYSLDAVMQHADDDIQRIELQKRRNPQSSSTRPLSRSGTVNTISTSESMRRSTPRPSSAPRAMRTAGNDGGNSGHPEYENLQEDTQTTREKDLIFRKFKLFEDKLKKQEGSIQVLSGNVKDISEKLEKCIDAQKQDRKTLLGLKDQITNIKTRMDAVSVSEEVKSGLLEGRSHVPGSNTDVYSHIHSYVDQQLQSFIATQLPSLLAQALASQSVNLPSNGLGHSRASTTQNDADISHTVTRQHKHVLETLSTLEREVLRQKSDTDRMRTKQAYLDKIYTELKENTHAKEQAYIQEHVKCINKYSRDYEVLCTSANEKLKSLLDTVMDRERNVDKLSQQLENHVDGTAGIFAGLDAQITRLVDQNAQTNNSLAQVLLRVRGVEEHCEELNGISCTLFEEVTKTLPSMKEDLHKHSMSIMQYDAALDALAKGQEDTVNRLSNLSESRVKSEEKIVQKIESVSENLKALKEAYVQSLHILTQSQQKLKQKQKDTLATLEDHQSNLADLKDTVKAQVQETNVRIFEQLFSLQQEAQRADSQVKGLERGVRESVSGLREGVLEVLEKFVKDQDAQRAQWSSLLLEDLQRAHDKTQTQLEGLARDQDATQSTLGQLQHSIQQLQHNLEDTNDDMKNAFLAKSDFWEWTDRLEGLASVVEGLVEDARMASEAAALRDVVEVSVEGKDSHVEVVEDTLKLKSEDTTNPPASSSDEGLAPPSPSATANPSTAAAGPLPTSPSAADTIQHFHELMERVQDDLLKLDYKARAVGEGKVEVEVEVDESVSLAHLAASPLLVYGGSGRGGVREMVNDGGVREMVYGGGVRESGEGDVVYGSASRGSRSGERELAYGSRSGVGEMVYGGSSKGSRGSRGGVGEMVYGSGSSRSGGGEMEAGGVIDLVYGGVGGRGKGRRADHGGDSKKPKASRKASAPRAQPLPPHQTVITPYTTYAHHPNLSTHQNTHTTTISSEEEEDEGVRSGGTSDNSLLPILQVGGTSRGGVGDLVYGGGVRSGVKGGVGKAVYEADRRSGVGEVVYGDGVSAVDINTLRRSRPAFNNNTTTSPRNRHTASTSSAQNNNPKGSTRKSAQDKNNKQAAGGGGTSGEYEGSGGGEFFTAEEEAYLFRLMAAARAEEEEEEDTRSEEEEDQGEGEGLGESEGEEEEEEEEEDGSRD